MLWGTKASARRRNALSFSTSRRYCAQAELRSMTRSSRVTAPMRKRRTESSKVARRISRKRHKQFIQHEEGLSTAVVKMWPSNRLKTLPLTAETFPRIQTLIECVLLLGCGGHSCVAFLYQCFVGSSVRGSRFCRQRAFSGACGRRTPGEDLRSANHSRGRRLFLGDSGRLPARQRRCQRYFRLCGRLFVDRALRSCQYRCYRSRRVGSDRLRPVAGYLWRVAARVFLGGPRSHGTESPGSRRRYAIPL